jgi:hypothetical protein
LSVPSTISVLPAPAPPLVVLDRALTQAETQVVSGVEWGC